MYAIIQHRVRDYDKWYPEFAAHEPIRRKHGLSNVDVFRGSTDQNEVLVTCEVPAQKNLENFLNDPSLEETMKRAGVTGKPTVITGKKLPRQESRRR